MYFKKNLWQRIKFAFKTLLSDAPLEEMYTTGYKAGVDEVINDYRLLKEKLVPILTELATPPQKLDDNFITYPDMSVRQLSFFNVEHPVPRFLHKSKPIVKSIICLQMILPTIYVRNWTTVKNPLWEEILAVKALAMTLKDNTYHKQIGNSTNAYNEEDEE